MVIVMMGVAKVMVVLAGAWVGTGSVKRNPEL